VASHYQLVERTFQSGNLGLDSDIDSTHLGLLCASCRGAMARAITFRRYEIERREENGAHYALVNLSQVLMDLPGPRHYVVPGEDTDTQPTLVAAAETLLELAQEVGHTTDLARVYQLVEIPSGGHSGGLLAGQEPQVRPGQLRE
jgi:hypothetical protein